MIPINEKKEKFIAKINGIFGKDAGKVLENIQQPKPDTFRINNLKASKEEVLGSLGEEGFQISEGPLPNSYIVGKSIKPLSQSSVYEKGQIYIQSLSSMKPVMELNPQPGEKILDMCAAPGSKTTQIAVLTNNQAQITAVENNKNRFFALKKNLEDQNARTEALLLESAQFLPKNHPELLATFDKVLVDSPCSNEGLICLCDDRALDRWNPKLAKKLSQLQKKLIAGGIQMLKPGGTLVYSTCTFSREENEEVAKWTLEKFPEMKLKKMERVPPTSLLSGFFLAKFVKSA